VSIARHDDLSFAFRRRLKDPIVRGISDDLTDGLDGSHDDPDGCHLCDGLLRPARFPLELLAEHAAELREERRRGDRHDPTLEREPIDPFRDATGEDERGGSPETVHHRNVTHDPHVAVHIGDGQEAIIVEGEVEIEKLTEEMAARLVEESFAKYPQYGRLDPSLYMGGVSVLRPRRVLAWTSFTENATRFRFE